MSGAITVAVDGWAATSLSVTVGAGNDSYAPTADSLTIIEYAIGLESWLDDAARPWFGSATFDMFPTDLEPWVGLRAECSTACTYAPNTALRELLDWPASGQSSTEIYTQTGAPSTCACELGVGDWLPRVEGAGPTSRSGSFLADSQAYALRPARIEVLGYEATMGALGVALRAAADPIWLYVARSGDLSREGPWLRVEPGDIARPSRNDEVYRVEFGVYG